MDSSNRPKPQRESVGVKLTLQRCQGARWLAFLFLILPIATLTAGGCKKPRPVAGENCTVAVSSGACLDPTMSLSCGADGKWHAAACLGPLGCKVESGVGSCDTSIAVEDAPCDTTGDMSCSRDKKSMMLCQNGAWKFAQKCMGPRGCEATDTSRGCDTSLATEGESCLNKPGAIGRACSVDGKALLVCDDKTWRKLNSCTGSMGCYGAQHPACNGPASAEGEFCTNPPNVEVFACSTDKKVLLKCESSRWQTARACRGPSGCAFYGEKDLTCDDSVQETGSPCEKDLSAACSVDGKTVLECRYGKFNKLRTCPKACKVRRMNPTKVAIECE